MSKSQSSDLNNLTISIDTGGTFTDVVVADEYQNFTLGKALTTRERVFLGVDKALESAAKKLGYKVGDFPVTEKQSKEILTLPVNQYLKINDLERIIAVVNEFITKV